MSAKRPFAWGRVDSGLLTGGNGTASASWQGWAAETRLTSVPRAARPRPRRPGASPPGFAALPENFSLPSLCTPGFAPQGIWGSDEPAPLLPPMSRGSWVQGALSLRSEPFAPFGMGSPPRTGSSGKASARPSWGLPGVMEAQGTPPSLSRGRVGYTRAPRAPSLALLLPACGSLGRRLRAVKCRPWPLLPWGLWRISSSLGENPVASGVCVFQGALGQARLASPARRVGQVPQAL